MRIGSLTPELLEALREAIANRQNILISGGTGTGKTTLLNALAHFIGDTERIVVIEDTAEIQLEKANLVRFEARREQPGLPAVTIRDLVRATFATGLIASFLVKSAGARRSTYSRPSIPATRERSPQFMETRRTRLSPV